MNTTKKLLDKYRATCYARSDNAIAKSLGLSRTAVSRWINETGHPDADSVEKMANAIGEAPGPWMIQIEAERARTPAARKAWLKVAATLGATFALVVVALPSHAAQTAVQTSAQTSAVYCVKLCNPWLADCSPLPSWRLIGVSLAAMCRNTP